ncbi:hypothetical protein BKA61DRAFT_573643 [Leptodontidium sp. MPI-SDFR-AT-0119]|nr:hypothetical protein BKA61DRAFT_573643 [Leptodontidium sp. MPI-SDFR-AT-0119]
MTTPPLPLAPTSLAMAQEDGADTLQLYSNSYFLQFPKLPAELRINVWRYAAHQPRLVEIGHAKSLRTTSLINPLSRKPTAILHTNRESRAEVFEVLQVTEFDGSPFNSPEGQENRPKLYFKPQVDVVYFGKYSSIDNIIGFLRYLPLTKVAKIPRVAIHQDLLPLATCKGPRAIETFSSPAR